MLYLIWTIPIIGCFDSFRSLTTVSAIPNNIEILFDLDASVTPSG